MQSKRSPNVPARFWKTISLTIAYLLFNISTVFAGTLDGGGNGPDRLEFRTACEARSLNGVSYQILFWYPDKLNISYQMYRFQWNRICAQVGGVQSADLRINNNFAITIQSQASATTNAWTMDMHPDQEKRSRSEITYFIGSFEASTCDASAMKNCLPAKLKFHCTNDIVKFAELPKRCENGAAMLRK